MQQLDKTRRVSAYGNTDVSPEQSVQEINEMLAKFGVGHIFWNNFNPENASIVFDIMEKNQRLFFKVPIPFVSKSGIYNEAQSLRILYHKIKALMIDLELGSRVYEIFANNLVIGARGSEMISIADRNRQAILEGNVRSLYLP